jgi:hypothetical protein
MKKNLTKRTLSTVAATLLVATGLLATTGAGASPATATAPAAAGSWPYPNGDLANTRVATSSTISSTNVSELKQAWTFKLTGMAAAGVGTFKDALGSLAANPVVVNGVVYLQDLEQRQTTSGLGSHIKRSGLRQGRKSLWTPTAKHRWRAGGGSRTCPIRRSREAACICPRLPEWTRVRRPFRPR